MSERIRFTLDGEWQFWTDPAQSLSPASLGDHEAIPINVPAVWQSQSSDLRFYTGPAWYRHTLDIPADWLGDAIILGFGAVDYHAEVWLNDSHLGDHDGGYLPFTFDVSAVARAGSNTLTVLVTDPAHLFPEIPHGKQSWYGMLSGIWQSVWLERRSALHIAGLRLQADLASGDVQVTVQFSSAFTDPSRLRLQISDPDGKPVAEYELPVATETRNQDAALHVRAPLAWAPEHPHLYTLQVQLVVGETSRSVDDSVGKTFGFRTIETRAGGLWLNGEPLYVRAALDQDYYPGTIYTPPSLEFLEDEMRKAKDLGLNGLRLHIKAPDPRYYDVADRLGLLVWSELPNWKVLTERAAAEARATLAGIIERDDHHPCIFAWSIINEGWGLDLVNDPTHRSWLRDMYDWVKQLDPSRLVIDNSACPPNYHIKSDLDDYHCYAAIPDHQQKWDSFVASLASRPAWTFSQHGDAVRTGQEPILVSEFGNWGLPDIDRLAEFDGRQPWWLETGSEWDQGIVYPHGVRERFEMWRLDKVFGSWQAFLEATQWQEYEALKYEIETIRLRPEISGYVITEFTDVHWEANGLLDIQRNPKVFAPQFPTINADTVLIPSTHRRSFWPGEPVQVSLALASTNKAALRHGAVRWRLPGADQYGVLDVPEMPENGVSVLEPIRLLAPWVAEPEQRRLELELQTDGCVLARNSISLTFQPERSAPRLDGAALWTPDPELARWLATLGYRVAPNRQAADAVVHNRLDQEMMVYIREGGRFLLLAKSQEALPEPFTGLRIGSRKDTVWSGDWASSFAWLRRDGPFARLPGGPLLDRSFGQTIPELIIHGYQPWEFEADVFAGLFVGWVHRPVATIAQRRYGYGRAVLSTFRLTGTMGAATPAATEPNAITLLDALIELTLAS